jgi:hypothetical protein
MVVIGDNSLRNSYGTAIHPPWSAREPGVLFHASTAYTLAIQPLWELNHATRTALDLALAAPFFFIVYRKAQHYRESHETLLEKIWTKAERRVLLFAELYVLFLGIVLMVWASVMWLEFLVAMAALALHPYLGRKLEQLAGFVLQRIDRRKRCAKGTLDL